MKNSIYSKEEKNVSSSIGTRCNSADHIDYKGWENRLRPLDIIPEGKREEVLSETRIPYRGYDGPSEDVKIQLLPKFTKPSMVRTEDLITLIVPAGIHPIDLIKPEVVNHAWIFISPKVVEELEKFPYKFKQDTIECGEFFRLESNDSFTLQEVEYFDGWKILRECEINDTVYQRPDQPEYIIEFVMEK